MVKEFTDPSDGLPVLPIKAHTQGKLTFLSKYLPAYTKILRSKVPNRPRYYVDFFCGPGKCIEKTMNICDGSPLIAVKTNPPFTNHIFIDINEEYCKALKTRLTNYANVNVIQGDCNTVVSDVLSSMDTDDPCFVFLDPFGLELQWKTVEKLSAKRRIDILINFPVGAVCRSMKRMGAENTVTECLGETKWASYRESSRPLRFKLRDLYMEKMQRFFKCTSPKLVYNRKHAPLYYLIYACHFDVGQKIWEDITKPQKAHSLLAAFGDAPEGWVYVE